MTDDHSRDGRLDLRALDAATDSDRTDTIVAAALARISAKPRDDLAELRRYRRALVAAAAVLLIAATASVLARPVPAVAPVEDPIAGWARSSHVPTNGELLAAYHGYRP